MSSRPALFVVVLGSMLSSCASVDHKPPLRLPATNLRAVPVNLSYQVGGNSMSLTVGPHGVIWYAEGDTTAKVSEPPRWKIAELESLLLSSQFQSYLMSIREHSATLEGRFGGGLEMYESDRSISCRRSAASGWAGCLTDRYPPYVIPLHDGAALPGVVREALRQVNIIGREAAGSEFLPIPVPADQAVPLGEAYPPARLPGRFELSDVTIEYSYRTMSGRSSGSTTRIAGTGWATSEGGDYMRRSTERCRLDQDAVLNLLDSLLRFSFFDTERIDRRGVRRAPDGSVYITGTNSEDSPLERLWVRVGDYEHTLSCSTHLCPPIMKRWAHEVHTAMELGEDCEEKIFEKTRRRDP